MKKILICALSVVLILTAFPIVNAEASTASDSNTSEPLRILAIGNSYSNNATQFIDRIAENLGYNVEAYSLYYPGCSIRQHVQYYQEGRAEYALATDGTNLNWSVNTMQKAFDLYDYDIITIQETPVCYDFSTYWTESKPWLTQLVDIIKQNEPQAEIMIHQTWSFPSVNYQTSKDMFTDIEQCYKKAAEKIGGADIIPSGKAVQLAKDEFGFGDFYNESSNDEKLSDAQLLENGALYTDDIYHLNIRGRYMASCVWIESILNTDCRKTTYVPELLTEEECKILREIAHEAVTGEQDTVDGNWRYLQNGSGVKLMHYNGTVPAHGNIQIPAKVGGKNVNAVSASVFKYVNGIKHIYIPDTELDIEKGTFDIKAVNSTAVNSISFDTEVTSGGFFVDWWNTYQGNPKEVNFLVDTTPSRINATVLYDGKYGYSNIDHTGNDGKSIRIEKNHSSSGYNAHTFTKIMGTFGRDKTVFEEADLGNTYNISFWVYLERTDKTGGSETFQYGLSPIAKRSTADTAGYGFYGKSYTKKVNVGEWTRLDFDVTLDETHIGDDQIGLLSIYLDDTWNQENGDNTSIFYLDDIKVEKREYGTVPVTKGEYVATEGFSVTYMNGKEVYAKEEDLPEGTVFDITRVVPNTDKEYFAGWFLDEAFTNEITDSITISKDTVLYAKMLPYKTSLNIAAEKNPTKDTYFTGFGAVKYTAREAEWGGIRGLIGGVYGVSNGKYGDLLTEGLSHRHSGYGNSDSTKVNGKEVRDLSNGAVWQWLFNGDYILRDENGDAFIVKPNTTYKVTLTYTNEKTSAAAETAKAKIRLSTGLSASKLLNSSKIKLYSENNVSYTNNKEMIADGINDNSENPMAFNYKTDEVVLEETTQLKTVELTITTPTAEKYNSLNLLQVLSITDVTNYGMVTSWESISVEEVEVSKITGDVNGDGNVDATDLALLKKVIAGLTPLDDPTVKNPNVSNKTGKPDAADLALLKKIIAGIS